jgi:hypothetical protein
VTAPGLQFLVALVSGWVNRNQQEVIDFLQAENRLLLEQLGPGPHGEDPSEHPAG